MLKVRLTDGAELAIREFGQGKQPVVLLHGLGMDSSQWLAPLWPYRKHYRFILPDFRGAGLSRQVHIAQQDVFQSHAEDILEVINTLQLDPFLLVGYSLGGSTALHLNHLGKWDGVKAYLHIDQSPALHNRADWAYGMMGPNQAGHYPSFSNSQYAVPVAASGTQSRHGHFVGDICHHFGQTLDWQSIARAGLHTQRTGQSV